VKELKPDAVVIAVGTEPTVPKRIPGAKGPSVVSVEDVMSGRVQAGKRIAIWTCSYHCTYTCKQRITPVEGDPTRVNSTYSYACRAGYAAVDAAEYLASQGKLVNIVTERSGVVPGMGYTSRNYLLKRFYRANIRVCSNAKVKEINDGGMILVKAGITFLLDADTVIVSVGETMRKDLAAALKEQVREVYTVGDCDQIGNAMKAIESAYGVALKI
jgi:pyruvate/2-oxoglutarate dehydrogenase complex dihydrolipoamide dehydrogenase (E3) component